MERGFSIGNLDIAANPPFFILGPCVIEGRSETVDIARRVRKIADDLNLSVVFKASFDKANRSSLNSYRGPGLREGLDILRAVRDETGLPVISDIHEPAQAESAGKVLDALQIPAFLCRQTDLLLAAGDTGLPINVKKGQFMAPGDMARVVEKIHSTGNRRVMLTERGSFFGYHDLVVDFRSIPVMKSFEVPVIIDATHAVQRPAEGRVSGGQPQFIPHIAAAGVVCGADGVFLEVHPHPEKALSDGANSLPLDHLEKLLIRLRKLHGVS
ncbi:MAG: 3-deoxy-8-phosphooctulonate synthase [Acidobacteriota bacterium]|jgi:2-dehydro-3-deoxyphosphooctonate aldolase (KDO 8-P synthase)|nr:3-deoxy-8-phosphooctulonate synthase [Acidobacteriota bacterium]